MIQISCNGNLTSDVEVRQSQRGEYVNFIIACRKDIKDEQGNYLSDFFKVTAFGNNVNYLKQYGKKGLKAMVSGKFSSRLYQKKDGTFGTSLEIVADRVEMLTYPQKNVETRPAYTQGYVQTGGYVATPPTVTVTNPQPAVQAAQNIFGSNVVYQKDINSDGLGLDEMELPFD